MKSLEWTTEKRNVVDLKHFEKNPRKITTAAMEKLKDRIRKRGFHDVVKIDTQNVILSGNMRTDALVALGVKEVNVLVPTRPLTKEERDAIVLESNRNDGEWDQEVLPEFSTEVLLEVGFEGAEVDAMRTEDDDVEDEFDAEKVAQQIKKPHTKRGDLYQLGEHRLLCGDSTKPEDLEKLMATTKADLVFTDPPYNMNYRSQTKGGILNDNIEEEAFVDFCVQFTARMRENTKAGAPFYICSGYQSYTPFVYALKVNKLNYAGPIIWVKNSLGMGMNDYRHSHEMILKAKKEPEPKRGKKAQPILYGWNEGKHFFAGGHDEADVWNVARRAGATMVHPTQKPLALINRALKNSSKRGGVVLDLFGGSGSTLIAAQKTNRKAYVMELDPKYCDAIVQRWEALTDGLAEKI